ncbi:hypothetical protein [Aquimarina aggregata]|uniref:hypothetical protein n=1 Tax=Aquimarina aggregata TaxID=1642818 RepID=UPI00249052B6|nr:hypothetical protein [Aquimarina aggregata]
MNHITRRSVEECIMHAYQKYLTSTQGNFICNTTDNGNITIQCVIHGDRFNCGFAGNKMDLNEINSLKNWCITHPGDRWSFGFRNTNPNHPDSVNVTLIKKTVLMFNFHVYLY